MADAKKVSFNQETAKSTERHNDRSMYKWGYDERSKNVHWDMYRCGSSFDAEARFYDDTFTPTLEAQNAKALAMRKYDRVMDMKTWHKKHPLKECIVQLGDVENNDTSREFAWGAAQVVGDAIKAAGGIVVSIDLHDDESTPHLHVRYAFVGENKDKNPVMDMKNVLLAHGIDRPDPSKPISKNNNPAQTFLETTRTMLEDYADELELSHGNPRVNRKREKRSHSSVQKYKLQKRVEELQRQEKEAIAARDAALAKAAETQQKADSAALAVSRREETVKNDENRLDRLSAALEEQKSRQKERDKAQNKRAGTLNEQQDDIARREGLLAMLKQQVLDLLAKLKGEIDKQLLEEMKQQAEEIEKTVVHADMSDFEDITTDKTDDYGDISL